MMDQISDFQVEQLADLLNHPAWPVFDALIQERVDDLTRKVVSGRCESHDEYEALCGSIRELLYLRDRPKQLIDQSRSTET